MPRINRQKNFAKIVEESLNAIPERFLSKLNNVDIVIESEPSPEKLKELKIKNGRALLGLYEGVPQAERGAYYGAVLPDKITIFQKSIEMAAKDEVEIKRIVRETVWHEIAHHFGMNEFQVRKLEAKKREKYNQ